VSHPSSGSLSLCYAASVFSSRSPAVTGRAGMRQDRELEHASDRHRCGWTMHSERCPRHWQVPTLPLDWPKTERGGVPPSGPDTSVEHGSSQYTRNSMLCREYTRRLRMQVLYSQITDPRDLLASSTKTGPSPHRAVRVVSSAWECYNRAVGMPSRFDTFGPPAWPSPSA
jgi:hypothetical protein